MEMRVHINGFAARCVINSTVFRAYAALSGPFGEKTLARRHSCCTCVCVKMSRACWGESDFIEVTFCEPCWSFLVNILRLLQQTDRRRESEENNVRSRSDGPRKGLSPAWRPTRRNPGLTPVQMSFQDILSPEPPTQRHYHPADAIKPPWLCVFPGAQLGVWNRSVAVTKTFGLFKAFQTRPFRRNAIKVTFSLSFS